MTEELTLARKGILDDLAKARESQSRVRRHAADLISTRLSQRLEVVVEPLGDREQFASDLRELLVGSGAQGSTIAAVASLEIADGPAIVATVERGADAIAAHFGVTPAQASKVPNWITDPEADRLAYLEALAPRDRGYPRANVPPRSCC